MVAKMIHIGGVKRLITSYIEVAVSSGLFQHANQFLFHLSEVWLFFESSLIICNLLGTKV